MGQLQAPALGFHRKARERVYVHACVVGRLLLCHTSNLLGTYGVKGPHVSSLMSKIPESGNQLLVPSKTTAALPLRDLDSHYYLA